MAIEEADYTVVIKDGTFEIRDYAPHVVAETLVEGTLEEAGNKAFDRLFRYISGGNRMREKVAMTAPVSQQPKGEKIPMTDPVAQQRVQERWAVSFTMPAFPTPESLPAPEDPQVSLRRSLRAGWRPCATPGPGANRATCDIKRNWSPGCGGRGLPQRAPPSGPATTPRSPSGSCGGTKSHPGGGGCRLRRSGAAAARCQSPAGRAPGSVTTKEGSANERTAID